MYRKASQAARHIPVHTTFSPVDWSVQRTPLQIAVREHFAKIAAFFGLLKVYSNIEFFANFSFTRQSYQGKIYHELYSPGMVHRSK